jgi:hypothetical protein
MTFKKWLLPALITLFTGFFATAQEPETIVYDANAEVRNVGPFTGLKVSSAIVVYISQGTESAVAVSLNDASQVSSVKTEVKNGVLHIYLEKGSWKSMNGKSAKAYVTIKDLQSLEVSGASLVRFADKLNLPLLKVDLSGASSVKGEMEVGSLHVDQSGASLFAVSGVAKEAHIEVSGASSFKAYELKVENCKADISGASSVQVTVSKELKVDASGASSFRFKGNPAAKDTHTSGASSIKQIED